MEILELVKNIQAQIALQNECLMVLYRKAGKKILDSQELDHVNTCVTAQANLFTRSKALLDKMEAQRG